MSEYHPPLRRTPTRPFEAIRPRPITPVDSPAIDDALLTFPLTAEEIKAHVHASLEEDEAFSDISTMATVISVRHTNSAVVARSSGVVAGIPMCVEAFRQLDSSLTVQIEAEDGTHVASGDVLLRLTGQARGVLSAERVALNYLQHLSGIATLTSRFVDAIKGTSALILDTRKTTPGWRKLEKYAVRAGGGTNHRLDLRSGVLIKDNHLAAIKGDIAAAVTRARGLAMPGTPVQVECDTMAQVVAALEAGADWVLLDNMSIAMIREAVALCAGKATTEASGGVTLDTVRRIAETGVDRISVGALTHSAPALDLALDFENL